MLTRCQCAQPPCVLCACIRMITCAHKRLCSPWSEFGALRKHEKTQHALKSGRIISLLVVAKKKKKNQSFYPTLSPRAIQIWPVLAGGAVVQADQ